MSPVTAKLDHPTMKTFVLLAGDGDFTDMVKFMRQKMNVNVVLVSWSASVNYGITQLVNQALYLDEIWIEISVD